MISENNHLLWYLSFVTHILPGCTCASLEKGQAHQAGRHDHKRCFSPFVGWELGRDPEAGFLLACPHVGTAKAEGGPQPGPPVATGLLLRAGEHPGGTQEAPRSSSSPHGHHLEEPGLALVKAATSVWVL